MERLILNMLLGFASVIIVSLIASMATGKEFFLQMGAGVGVGLIVLIIICSFIMLNQD